MICSSTRICNDCVHFRHDKTFIAKKYCVSNGFCTHPESATIDVVSGDITYQRASIMRYKDTCGFEGKLYEKEKNQFTLLIKQLPDMTNFTITFVILLVILLKFT